MNRTQTHSNARPNGRPKRRPAGERARRLLQMLARGQSIDDAARQLKRPRQQVERHMRSLLALLRAATPTAALAALDASPAAAQAAEQLEPDDAALPGDNDTVEQAADAPAEAASDAADAPPAA
jgi:DNA-binding CsgD family transcriptional regulator